MDTPIERSSDSAPGLQGSQRRRSRFPPGTLASLASGTTRRIRWHRHRDVPPASLPPGGPAGPRRSRPLSRLDAPPNLDDTTARMYVLDHMREQHLSSSRRCSLTVAAPAEGTPVALRLEASQLANEERHDRSLNRCSDSSTWGAPHLRATRRRTGSNASKRERNGHRRGPGCQHDRRRHLVHRG